MNKKLLILIIVIILIVLLSTYLYFNKEKKFINDTWLYNQEKEIPTYSSSKGSHGFSFDSFSDISSFSSSASDSISSFSSSDISYSNNLGYSTGGAKTIENFRENINHGYFPISTDITYNGLFYDYSFDTGNIQIKSNDLFYPSYSTAISKDLISGQEEYYMSVGLNSNLKESDFARPKLNLVVVLDNSGSMNSSFNSYYYDDPYSNNYNVSNKNKMEIANNAVNTLIDQLNKDDRFGMVVFNSSAQIAKYLYKISDTNVDNLKENILSIKSTGGTNFEDGYKKALDIFKNLDDNNSEYQNRIIVITDAMPNIGTTLSSDLSKMVEDSSKNGIYTTFIGVGVDFNTELIEKLGTVEGANYYSVHSEEEFQKQMDEDFDFMVTPLVFDLNLNFKSNDYSLEAVYGTDTENNKKGNVMHVNTLFPSRRNDSGEVKGGIILLKLKRQNNSDNGKITLEVTYRDTKNKNYQNSQEVTFNREGEYYDNTGIRKGILLTRYANLLKDWILYERSDGNDKFLITDETGIIDPPFLESEVISILGEHERTSVKLTVSDRFQNLFKEMKNYFETEINELNDNDLNQEIDILEKLIEVTRKNQNIDEEYNNSNSFLDFWDF